MLMKFARNGRLLAGIPFLDGFLGNQYDKVETSNPTVFYDTEELENTTGLQRLRSLFRKQCVFSFPRELKKCVQTSRNFT